MDCCINWKDVGNNLDFFIIQVYNKNKYKFLKKRIKGMSQKQLDLKNEYEKNQLLLKDYDSKDLESYPGWTFLLPNVIEFYGICPYLNVDEPDFKNRRMKWLKDTCDKGKIYYETTTLIFSKDKQIATKNELESLKKQLKILVLKSIQDYNESISLEEESEKEAIDYNDLVDSIKKRADCKKGLSRKNKDDWTKTCNIIDDLNKFTNYLRFSLREDPQFLLQLLQIDSLFRR